MASAIAAAVALAVALWLTRDASAELGHDLKHLTVTPERAAESFILAYRSGAFDRAAELATGELARGLRARYRQGEARVPNSHQTFVVQESHRLSDERLRLLGTLVDDGADERTGTPVSIGLRRLKTRYLVEEIQW
jgi:hypothetical protein